MECQHRATASASLMHNICQECGAVSYEKDSIAKYGENTCTRYLCGTEGCSCLCWYVCLVCNCRLEKKDTESHFFSSRSHQELAALINTYSFGPPQKRIPEKTISGEAPASKRHCGFPDYQQGNIFNEANHWLSCLFLSQKKSDVELVDASFEGNTNMQLFWVAEHLSPEGTFGGAVRMLVGRAFQKTTLLERSSLPNVREALWHLQCFVHYHSMTPKQRALQPDMSLIVNPRTIGETMFQNTRFVAPKESNKFYGTSNPNSMWRTLPIPLVRNFGGVSYVNPLEIVKFALAFGLPIDEFWACEASSTQQKMPKGTIYHLTQSQIANEVKEDVISKLEPQSGPLVILWATTWRDGFSPNGTKQNRNSTVSMTLTISSTRERINANDNTFLVALGRKEWKEGWNAVEHQFRKDMTMLSDARNPVMVYHGELKKVVPVVVKVIAVIMDKPERAEGTYTLSSPQSRNHRCFGTLLQLDPPFIATKEIATYLKKQVQGDLSFNKWGWSHQFVRNIEGSPGVNGTFLPACIRCRSTRLNSLGFQHLAANTIKKETRCCANWCVYIKGEENLRSSVPANYPRTCSIRVTSVQSPDGREVPPPETLVPIKLSFEFLVQAVKFAFYNTCQQRGNCWTKANMKCYLATCGVPDRVQEQVYKSAVAARGMELELEISKHDWLGDFQLPAPWIDGDMSISMYIEAIMHQLFLGIAKQNYLLCQRWLSLSGAGYGTSKVQKFKRDIQPLLEALSKLQLSWLPVLPMSNSKELSEGGLSTGAWLSENWLAWTRISKLAYGWVTNLGERGKMQGSDDLSRVVISYVALVARILTHSGVDEETVTRVDDFVKEFLSCVQEFDIRIHHNSLAKNHASNSKKTHNSHTIGDPAVVVPNDESPILDLTVCCEEIEELCEDSNNLKSSEDSEDCDGCSDRKQMTLDDEEVSLMAAATTTNEEWNNYQDDTMKANKRDNDIAATNTTHAQGMQAIKVKDVAAKAGKKAMTAVMQSLAERKRVEKAEKAAAKKMVAEKKRAEKAEKAAEKKRLAKRKKEEKAALKAAKDAKKKKEAESKGVLRKEKKIPAEPSEPWWWSKVNYISLLNLPGQMKLFGPLVNLWDGKCEGFVPQIRCLIKRGIHKHPDYCKCVTIRSYKRRCLDFLRSMNAIPDEAKYLAEEPNESFVSLCDTMCMKEADGATQNSNEIVCDSVIDGTADSTLEQIEEDLDFCENEARQMNRTRTFYLYKNKTLLDQSLSTIDVIAGILVVDSAMNKALQFFAVFRKPRRKFGWKKINCVDNGGLSFHGHWCTGIQYSDEEDDGCPGSFGGLLGVAKMAAVAIPLRYIVGPGKKQSNKYCIITNWWKERNKDGRYEHPGLDDSFY